jgi:excisionase family DNA binding protein
MRPHEQLTFITKQDAMTAERPHPPTDTLLTIGQVAERLQVCTKTVRRFITAKDLVAHRIGGQLRISAADLQVFIRLRRDV